MSSLPPHAMFDQQWLVLERDPNAPPQQQQILPHSSSCVVRPQQQPYPPLNSLQQQQQIGVISAKKIINDIHHAVTPPQRLAALQTATLFFAHDNTELHDVEINHGAVNVLVVKLGYYCCCENDHCLELILKSLQHILTGCSINILRSLFESHKTKLLPLLTQVLQRTMTNKNNKNDSSQQECTLRILRTFAKKLNADGKSTLVQQQQQLTKTLIKLLWKLLERDDDILQHITTTTNHHPLKLLVLGFWKDLLFRLDNDDKLTLWNYHGWLRPILHSSCQQQHGDEYVSTILWNLALSPNVSTSMANNIPILHLLQSWIASSETTRKTKRAAVSAVGNLAMYMTHDKLLEHGLLEALQQTAQSSDDTDCRRRSMRTIRVLMSSMSHLTRREEMIEFCVTIAVQDVDSATRIQACECLVHVAGDGSAVELIGDILVLGLLEVVERLANSDPKVVLAAFRGLSICSERPNELALMRLKVTPALFVGLENALRISKQDAETYRLVGRFVARFFIAEASPNSDKLSTSQAVLHVLATLLSSIGPDFESSRSEALKLVSHLVATESNRRPMAEHDALLTALVNFCLAEQEGSRKDEAKSLILQLVPEL